MRKMEGDPELCSVETGDLQSATQVAVGINGATIGEETDAS